MNESDLTETAQAALDRRLLVVAHHLLTDRSEIDALAARGSGVLLRRLLVEGRRRDSALWLLTVGVTAAFPNADQMRMTQRAVRLADESAVELAFLEACFDAAARFDQLDKDIRVVAGGVVVDVDFCANHAHNTGIQRVVRQTMSRWSGERDVELVAWTAGGGAMRSLSGLERDRVVAWDSYREPSKDEPPQDPTRYEIVVPFGSAVILPEVPQAALCDPLAALAEYSGNRVGLIGYDTIPVVSADTLDSSETERFVRYLTIVKHAHRIAGISAAATEEFRGFVSALPPQGLAGPEAVEVSLPVDKPASVDSAPRGAGEDPLVICIGSQEPRKNHFAVLFAAESLWREGARFRLRFIGGGSVLYTRAFDNRVAQLRRAGRQIEVLRGVNDAALLAAYQEARFSLFPSLHEGYGLPVAESIAFGTPVVTTSYGSTGEIAADGGCLVVDPRDDDALIDAMRRLLTDTDELERLRAEIIRRPARTWDDYANDLWNGLVVPMMRRSVNDAVADPA